MKENKIMNAEQNAEAVQPQNKTIHGADTGAVHAEPQKPFKTFETQEEWQGEIDRIIGSRLRDDRITREKAEKFDRLTAARGQEEPSAHTQTAADFDLDKELQNPKFASLIAENGISAEEAYYLCHREELLSRARSAVAADISARRSRITESGTQSAPAASAFINPGRLSDSQIDDIFERVQNGEKIKF